MIDDHTLDSQLRDLNAVPLNEPIDRERQSRLLESLLASDPEVAAKSAPSPIRRRMRRVAWGSAAAVVVAAGAVVLPLTSGDRPAFASWTAEPATASEQDAQALRNACLEHVGDTMGGDGAPRVSSDDLQTRLADRRGDWVFVLLTWTGQDRYQFTVNCLGRLPLGSTDEPTDVTHSLSGGGGWSAPTRHELVEGSMAEFTVGGGFLGLGEGEQVATTDGQVGPDVVTVTIHAGSATVAASVEDGTYAAWWPGTWTDPTTVDAPSGEGGPEPILQYDITLRDGTVLSDVEPVHPLG